MDDKLVAKVLEIKESVDEAKQDYNKAKGAKEQLLGQLKGEFGCSTKKQAVALKQKLEKEIEEMTGELQEEVSEFDEEFGKKLNGDVDDAEEDDDD